MFKFHAHAIILFIAGLLISLPIVADIRLSVSSDGTEGNFDSGPAYPYSQLDIAANEPLVVFSSTSNNLVPNDTNRLSDIFLHNYSAETTERVSLSSTGAQALTRSYKPTISDNGDWIAFASCGDRGTFASRSRIGCSVFAKNLTRGTVHRLSEGLSGVEGIPYISGDGRYVAFQGRNSSVDMQIYRYDLVTHRRERLVDLVERDSTATTVDRRNIIGLTNDGNLLTYTDQQPGRNKGLYQLNIATDTVMRITMLEQNVVRYPDAVASNNGAYAVFISEPYINGIAGTYPVRTQIFLADLSTGSTTEVYSWVEPTHEGRAFTTPITVTNDGNQIIFKTNQQDLVTEPYSGSELFQLEVDTGRLTKITKGFDGSDALGSPTAAAITPNGNTLIYSSRATNVVADDLNRSADVFLATADSGPDPEEENNDVTSATNVNPAWTHHPARCSGRGDLGWDMSQHCPGIFEHAPNLPDAPRHSADIWTATLGNLSMDTPPDLDWFDIQLPQTADYPASADIRATDDRIWGSPKPMPDCGLTERKSIGPAGTWQLVNVSLGGYLHLRVEPTTNPSSADPLDPSGEQVTAIHQPGTPVLRTSQPEPLELRIDCPRGYDGFPSLRESVLAAFGERPEARAWLNTGGYRLEMTFVIEAHRGIPPWILDLDAGEGLRAINPVPCLGQPGFPGNCEQQLDFPPRISYPGRPPWIDCRADGPGCWDYNLLPLNEGLERLDWQIDAAPGMTFKIIGPDQKTVAIAEPIQGLKGTLKSSTSYRIVSKGPLKQGYYVLAAAGPKTTYQIKPTSTGNYQNLIDQKPINLDNSKHLDLNKGEGFKFDIPKW